MTNNFHNSNRQKLLYMVAELHSCGFGMLRIIPSVSPSGMYWRCSFINQKNDQECIASNWISKQENEDSKQEIILSILELTDLFIQENLEFLESCKGENDGYTIWYSKMLKQLKKDELPYAFADWKIPEGVWETSEDNEITTLPSEKKYY